MGFSKTKAAEKLDSCPVEIEGLGTLNVTYRTGMINKATTEQMKQDNYYVLSGTPAEPANGILPGKPGTLGVLVAWDFEDDEATAAARLEDENAPPVMMPITPASLDVLGNPVCFTIFQAIFEYELKKMKSRIKKA